jgi:TolA-binding protein
LLGLKAEDPEQAAANQLRAGLAYMRVVIHFPEHGYAPECLYRAGEICAKTGDVQQAAVLWSGLLDRYPMDAVWTNQARRSLEQMGRDPAAVARGAANRDEEAK